jgi:hypothetical protein
MKNKPLFYSIRELTEIFRNCQSLHEMQILIFNLESEFESYSISDRGFLLAMIGMAIMKISDDSQHSDPYEWKINLLLLGRIDRRDVKDTDVSQNSSMRDYEEPHLFV